MALAVAGAVIQGVTKNGLADPSLIGLNSGATFGLAMTYAFILRHHFIINDIWIFRCTFRWLHRVNDWAV